MLTIRAMSNGLGYSARHLEHSDYYAEGERVTGHWLGRGAELLGLARGRDREPRGTAGERCLRARHRAMAVSVCLDDRAQRDTGRELAAQPDDVALDRGQVHRREGAERHDGRGGSDFGNAAMTSEAMTPSGPTSAAARRPAAAWTNTAAQAACKGSMPLPR